MLKELDSEFEWSKLRMQNKQKLEGDYKLKNLIEERREVAFNLKIH